MVDSMIEISVWLIDILNYISQIAFAFLTFIFLPLAIFKKTRGISGIVFVYYSYLYGAIVWLLGLALTLIHWGGWGFIIGLFLLGVGVVPLGIIGEFLYSSSSQGFIMLFVLFLVFVFRSIGLALMLSHQKYLDGE
tara:strand:- start:108 stop:515 length:408 start_codon:yes stop_codon:yes gene_type:complete